MPRDGYRTPSLGTMKVKSMVKQEFDRKASTKTVGQLYPVLLSKDGLIIDGHHRKEVDPDWRSVTLEHIDSEEKLILARGIANWHRRSIPAQEKKEWVNALARIYEAQGFKIIGETGPQGGVGYNEISQKIVEELGVSKSTVMKYLHDKYKQAPRAASKHYGPRVPASQAIEKMQKRSPAYAGNLAKRHEKEVRDKLLNDESFQNEVLEKVGRKTGNPTPILGEGTTTGNPTLAINSISDGNELLNCLCSECTDRKKCQEMGENA